MTTAETQTHLRENPHELARRQLRLVGETFGIDPNLINVLANCKKAVEVSIPVTLDDGSVGVFAAFASPTTSRAGRPRAAFATTRTSRSTRSGARDVDDVEVRPDGVPFGGAKGGVACNPKRLTRGARGPHAPLYDGDHQ